MAAIFRRVYGGWFVISDKNERPGSVIEVTRKTGARVWCLVEAGFGRYEDAYCRGFLLAVNREHVSAPTTVPTIDHADALSNAIIDGGGRVDLSVTDKPPAPTQPHPPKRDPEQKPQRKEQVPHVKGDGCGWFRYLDIDPE